MGRLKILKSGPMATIQDLGRFGYRRFGIPQCGAMDRKWMETANQGVGNPVNYPVVEFAMLGLKVEVMEETTICVVGAKLKIDGVLHSKKAHLLTSGSVVDILEPDYVYAYLAIGGRIKAQEEFGSVSTYVPAGFGGISGKALAKEDELISIDEKANVSEIALESRDNTSSIRIMKGPEWDVLKELPTEKQFRVASTSNRIGIRLEGFVDSQYREIASSAVLPGTIQVPPNGQPIILMNDCQTTGGYPRIGKVIEEDLGRLAQVKPGQKVALSLL